MKTKKPYHVPSPEGITDDKLREIADDPDYPEEHREYVRTALKSGDSEAIEEMRLGVWGGDCMSDLTDILERENGAGPHISRMRKIMNALLCRIDHSLIIEDMPLDLIKRYFDFLSDDYGKKPYIFPYNNILEESIPLYLKFEMMETVEEREALIVRLLNEPPTQVLIVLLITHLNACPGFLGRLLTNPDISEEDLKKLVNKLKEKSMGRQVLNYLMFDVKRRKQIDSCIHKDGGFYPKSRTLKKVHQLDRQFFDKAAFHSGGYF